MLPAPTSDVVLAGQTGITPCAAPLRCDGPAAQRVDCAVIALWLGHESMETTQIYLHASLELKQQALAKTAPTSGSPGRYRPDDALLTFLKSL